MFSYQFSVLSFQFDALVRLLPESIVYRLGWTLVHFVWQGAMIAMLVGLTLAALRRRSAHARYVAGCAGLLLMLVAAGVTLFAVGSPGDNAASVVIRQPADSVGGGMAGRGDGMGVLPVEASWDSESTPPKPPLLRGGKKVGETPALLSLRAPSDGYGR